MARNKLKNQRVLLPFDNCIEKSMQKKEVGSVDPRTITRLDVMVRTDTISGSVRGVKCDTCYEDDPELCRDNRCNCWCHLGG